MNRHPSLPGNRVYCGTLNEACIGQTVTVCGWVARTRDLGGLIFVNVRDREGLVQCVFNEAENKELFDKAFTLRAEYTVRVTGLVRKRSSVNEKIPTGRVEIVADSLDIFSASETPPFEILDELTVNDTLRLKYRYLDLRRPALQRALMLRHRAAQVTREFFNENGFLEIETPVLTKSTPEGARDYLVPSRVHPGEFYALPQSPQQFKQLLMLAGFDRYMQIVRCFRDEDLRYDRQPEFTQVDLEMSFVDVEDVIEVNERYIRRLLAETIGVDVPLPLPRMTYAEAMARFGSDKPDLRFGFELCELSETVRDSGFAVFDGALAAGGYVGAINVTGAAAGLTRKEIDSLGEYVKTYRAKGLAWARLPEQGEMTSSFAKFLSEPVMRAVLDKAKARPGDVLLCVADADRELAQNALGALRCEVARRLDAVPQGTYAFLWVTEFPLFEYGEDDDGRRRLYAKHHPFTAPMDEDTGLWDTNPIAMRAKAYDLVLNGTELGGGSIRIHRPEVQARMFAALGYTREQAEARFGHLLQAFRYGTPPHGGIAYGLDRVAMHLAGTDNIRDVIAFPKVQNASDLLMECPSPVDEKQLRELGIRLDLP